MPGALGVVLPVGARVVVASGLRLRSEATDISRRAAAQVAQAVRSWSGPGAVIVAGDFFDVSGPEEAGRALAAHPELVGALRDFAGAPGRQVVLLPGARDAWVLGAEAPPAHEGTAQVHEAAAQVHEAAAQVTEILGAQVAPSVIARFSTAGGEEVVRIEPATVTGAARPPLVANLSAGSGGGYGRLAEVVPGIWRGSTSGWLSGLDELDDQGAEPRFVASRLLYRQFGRRAWLLAMPVLAALPIALWHPARHVVRVFLVTTAAIAGIELVMVVGLALAFLRQLWSALSARSGPPADLNEQARAEARQAGADGLAGLVSAGTGRPELVGLGKCFYANPGSCAATVREYPVRLLGAILPSVFLATEQVCWLELEAGTDLHARLLVGQSLLPGATFVERALLHPNVGPQSQKKEGARASDRSDGTAPSLAASFPRGGTWPRPLVFRDAQQSTRRVAAAVVAGAGLLSMLSAVAYPVARHLGTVSRLFPLAVPQAAGALATLGGVALITLAFGIRRGQRRAFLVCEATLVAVGIAHLLRGARLLAAFLALAVAVFLWSRRQFFRASGDLPPVKRSLGALLGFAAVAVLVGTVSLEGDSWVDVSLRHSPISTISWGQAFLATVQRMVAVQHVRLPPRLNGFFTPAMLATAAGLVLFAGWTVFRPVVSHRAVSHRAVSHRSVSRREAGSPRSLTRARAIVARHGGGTLDYFALRADKQFFFWGETLVAYAVYGGVCLVSPDPVGPAAQREGAWRAFRQFVDSHSWSPAVIGAGESWLPIYRSSGMHDLYVGDEAVVRVKHFGLEGGRFKGLRQAVHRIARYGYTIAFFDPSRAPAKLAADLEDVMTRSRKGGVERGFSMTLGRIFDPADRGLLLAVVDAPDGGGPVGFCQYVPAPAINGFSLDLMRRDNREHPNGLMDFVIVETLRYLDAHGYEGLGLNFATMRAVLAGEAGDGLSQKAQAWLVRRMSGQMQIESLWRFNAKFAPEWQPRYAVYGSPEHALPTALAVARAESFWELPLIGRFLVPGANRQAGGEEQPDREPALPAPS